MELLEVPLNAPNSFLSDGLGGRILTLWGADGFTNGEYSGSNIGLDLRVHLSAVPLPAALPLFGTGLGIMGFIGWRRKRRMAASG